MDNVTIGFSAALLMGLAFGAGPCNITCLPYLGPVFLGQKNNTIGTSWKTIIPFSLGRLTGYTLLGTIAGSFGFAATSWIKDGFAGQILGIATILVGLFLLRGTFFKQKSCSASNASSSTTNATKVHEISFLQKHHSENKAGNSSSTYLSFSLFIMGTGMALNPCIPLITILTVAATMATPVDGARLGVAFGLGAVIIPSLFFAFAVSYFSQQIKDHLSQWRQTLERISGSMLILLGTLTALGWIQP